MGQQADEPAPLSGIEQGVGLAAGLWLVIGLFLDGWAHDDARPESFFTPWHGVLYSGFAVAAVTAVEVVRRRHAPGRAFGEALPRGHGLTLLGLGVFAVGALGDLAWHEGFGIEIGVEALLSPTHLVLLIAGLLLLSAPIRTAWASPAVQVDRLGPFLPVILDLALLAAVSAFFLAYLSPFINDAAAQRFDPTGLPHDHPSDNVAELRQMLGLASILVTTVVLAVPAIVVLRRWRPPAGAMTWLLALLVFFLVGLDQFEEWFLLVPAVVAGLVIDLTWQRLGTPLAVAAGTGVLWTGYFVAHALMGDPVRWSAELVGGAVVSGALVALAIAVAAPDDARLADFEPDEQTAGVAA